MREIKDFTKPMKLIYMERMFMKKKIQFDTTVGFYQAEILI